MKLKFGNIVNWLNNKLSRTQYIIVLSILVGVSSGIAAVILKTLVHYIQLFLSLKLFSNYHLLVLLLCPLIGIVLTIIIIKILFNGKLGKGISNILYEIAQKSSFVHRDKIYSHVITSAVTVGFGGSAGLESPIVVTGSAIGSNYGKLFLLNYKDRTVLLAAGAAAGIAAVFNAPVAGVMFAIEVLLANVTVAELLPILVASVCGGLVSKIILQEEILFFFKLKQSFDYHNIPYYILLGILSGFISVYYSRVTHYIEGFFNKYKKNSIRRALIGGSLVGLLCFVLPDLFGEGYHSIKMLAADNPEKILENTFFSTLSDSHFSLLIFVGLIMLFKVIATSVTIASGGNGGNFAPTLFVGAYLGFFFSRAINLINPGTLPEGNFTIVGMSGILSGVMHAPLTGIFLIAEITGGYELFIPLMVVVSLSFLISRHFEPYSMDTKKLASKGLIFTTDKDKNILSKIKLQPLIETDIKTLLPEDMFSKLVEMIKTSHRNVFAVVNKNNELKGIITLDDIRESMFKKELYNFLTIRQLMKHPGITIHPTDDIKTVLRKFEESNCWNLPVTDHKKYLGFISKSVIYIKYREELLEQAGIII